MLNGIPNQDIEDCNKCANERIQCDSPPNGCGLHVHSGRSCHSNSSVGGHYFHGTQDPWSAYNGAYYPGNQHNFHSTQMIVQTGYSLQDNIGHVIVIHARDGTRIGCGVLDRINDDDNDDDDDDDDDGDDDDDDDDDDDEDNDNDNA